MGRRAQEAAIESNVRGRRLAAGLSQAALAERAGLTRQAVNAVEAGRYVPNTVVALRLAGALGCTVEELFALPDRAPRLEAELIGDSLNEAGVAQASPRVQLARVGGRLLARRLSGATGTLTPADGVGVGMGVARPSADRRLTVDLLVDPALAERTVVVAGCDPALALIGAHLTRRYPGFRLLWLQSGSLAALRALGRGEAHAAGSHLRDPERGEDNLPAIRRELAGRRLLVVGLAEWQQGLIVAPGNPKGIHEVADLLCPDVVVANREPGSGGRALLEQHAQATGIAPAAFDGLGRQLPSHMAVAEAVAGGLADTGPGILAAARAYGLDFIPLQAERYDLVIPAEHLESPLIQSLLEVATSPSCRTEVESLGGYDSARAGSVVADLR